MIAPHCVTLGTRLSLQNYSGLKRKLLFPASYAQRSMRFVAENYKSRRACSNHNSQGGSEGACAVAAGARAI